MDIDELVKKLEIELNTGSGNILPIWKRIVKEIFRETVEMLDSDTKRIFEDKEFPPKEVMLSTGAIPEVNSIKFYKITLTSALTLALGGESLPLPMGRMYRGFLVGIDERNNEAVKIEYYHRDRISHFSHNIVGEDFFRIAPILELIIKKNRKGLFSIY